MADFLEQLKKSVKAKEASGESTYAWMRDTVDDDAVRIGWRDGDRWRSHATETPWRRSGSLSMWVTEPLTWRRT